MVMELVRSNTRPSEILTREAFENAIAAVAGTRRLDERRPAPARDRARGGRAARARGLRHDRGADADRRRPEAVRPLRRHRPAGGGRRSASSRASSSAPAASTPTSAASTAARSARSRPRSIERPGQDVVVSYDDARQADRRDRDPARLARARGLRRQARRPRAAAPPRPGARLRLRGGLLRRGQGALDRARRRGRDPLRGAGRRPGHARDAARDRRARRRGARRRDRADHRRPLLGRDPRPDGRPHRARGRARRPDRRRARRRHDRARRREPPARPRHPGRRARRAPGRLDAARAALHAGRVREVRASRRLGVGRRGRRRERALP